MIIRAATIDDADVVAQFNVLLAAETEDVSLDPHTVLDGVRNALTNDLGARYWVAEIDGSIAGQLMTTREWSDWQNGWYVWLQSVYVAAEFRGKGVFRSLLQHVQRNAADAKDVYSIRLYVEEENVAARETYARLGFSPTGYVVLESRI